MSNTVPNRAFAPLVGVPAQPSADDRGPRRVSVMVAGAPVVVDCPSWCVSPHDEDVVALGDVDHYGPAVALPAPTFSRWEPRTVDVLSVAVAEYPFMPGGPRTVLVLDANGDGETAELGPDAALAFADQLVAHAAEIRRQVRTLGGRS